MRLRMCALLLLLGVTTLAAAPPATVGVPTTKKDSKGRPIKGKKLDLKIEGNTVLVVKSMPCTITAPAGADFYIWNYPETVTAKSDEANGNVLVVTDAPRGASTINVLAVTINFTIDKDNKVTKETVKDSGSVILVTDRGPAPGPTPDPPGPTPPGPDPAPLPTDKLAVMIIENEGDRGSLPKGQLESITSTIFRGWVKSQVGKDSGGQPLFRVYDPTMDLSSEDPFWQNAMKVERKSLPWLLVSNGKAGYSGPLLNTVAENKALISKYATSKSSPPRRRPGSR